MIPLSVTAALGRNHFFSEYTTPNMTIECHIRKTHEYFSLILSNAFLKPSLYSFGAIISAFSPKVII